MIYMGADHRGYELKEKLKKYLEELGHDFIDMGAFKYDKDDDYPDFAKIVGEKVAENAENRGVLICGSGIGISIAANKIKGIRAGTATTPEQIKASVNDESLNVLAIPSDFVGELLAKDILEAFVGTPYGTDERYIRRIKKIEELEKHG